MPRWHKGHRPCGEVQDWPEPKLVDPDTPHPGLKEDPLVVAPIPESTTAAPSPDDPARQRWLQSHPAVQRNSPGK